MRLSRVCMNSPLLYQHYLVHSCIFTLPETLLSLVIAAVESKYRRVLCCWRKVACKRGMDAFRVRKYLWIHIKGLTPPRLLLVTPEWSFISGKSEGLRIGDEHITFHREKTSNKVSFDTWLDWDRHSKFEGYSCAYPVCGNNLRKGQVWNFHAVYLNY